MKSNDLGILVSVKVVNGQSSYAIGHSPARAVKRQHFPFYGSTPTVRLDGNARSAVSRTSIAISTGLSVN